VEISPSLGRLIRPEPATFERIRKGQQRTLNLIVAAAANATLGTATGTIQLRRGKVDRDDPECDDDDRHDAGKLLPQALNVTVNVWQSLSRPELHFSIKYPPGWTVQENEQGVTFSNVAVSAPISGTSLQTQSFFVRLLSQGNPGALPVLQRFDQYFSKGFAVAPLSKTALTLGGHPAVQIQTSEIGRRVHVYLSLETDIIEISYGLFAPAFVSDYEGMLQTVEVN
jgi:hypothetical protein